MRIFYTFSFTWALAFIFSASQAQVVVSELNYNSDSTVSAGDWVELWNPSAAPVDISGWKMVDGNLGNFPYTVPGGTVLAPGGRLVIADNLTKFDQQHPGVPRLGPLGFEFANSGETVTLQNAAAQVQVQFTYSDSLPWNRCADGFGRTLELLDPAWGPNDPNSWRCGCIKGSPGAAFSPCTNETLLISEINYNSPLTAEAGDWVELWNKTNGAVNLSGYRLRDNNNTNIYTFPGGTTLNPQERLVIFNDAVNFTVQHSGVTKKIGPFSFGFGADGDAIRIYNASDRLVQSLWYEDNTAWYEDCADGFGGTLELALDFDPADDISSYTSWFCGCPKGSPATPFVNSCDLGVDETQTAFTLRAWPNPTADNLYVETTGTASTYRIVGMDGKVWAQGQLTNDVLVLDVTPFPAGMYLLSVGDAHRVKWVKR